MYPRPRVLGLHEPSRVLISPPVFSVLSLPNAYIMLAETSEITLKHTPAHLERAEAAPSPGRAHACWPAPVPARLVPRPPRLLERTSAQGRLPVGDHEGDARGKEERTQGAISAGCRHAGDSTMKHSVCYIPEILFILPYFFAQPGIFDALRDQG